MDGQATKADLVDILTMQNLALEGQLLQLKQELFRRSLIEKYGPDVIRLAPDGTIVRTPPEAPEAG